MRTSSSSPTCPCKNCRRLCSVTAAIRRLREQVCGADHFIALAKKYTDIRDLTPELLRLFIRKIVVHEKDVKWSKRARQTVEIYYNDIGCVDTQADETKSALESA